MTLTLFVSYSGALGGAERILLDYAAGLEGEVVLACPEGSLAQAARSQGRHVFVLRERSLLLRDSARARLGAVRQLAAHGVEARRLIGDLNPDLVVAWGMRSALACLLGPQVRVPIAFQHNDLLPGPVIARAVRRAAERAGVVLALSHTAARDLDPEGALGSRLTVVYPGIELSRFEPTGEPEHPTQVLVLGALVQWKRPDLALEACALARQRCPQLQLRLVGSAFKEDGQELLGRLRARALAPDLAGAVELVGQVPDPLNELRRAACLLHCAPSEPFGMAVLEALAAGRPAIVPDAAGPAEIVDSSCGRRYSPGDAAAAAEALVEVLSDPALLVRLGAAGRTRVQARFELEQSRRRWAAATQRISRRRRTPAISPRELAIVTVTHNSAGELRRLLASVTRHLPGSRVVVVDSGSSDDSLAVAEASASTSVIDLGANAGFGSGCNAGVASLSEPVTVLLNPDVELLDDSLLELGAEALAPTGSTRLLAPRVLYPDGARQDTVHPLPTSAADLVRTLVPTAALPDALAQPLAPWRADAPRRVGWAVGCALLARTETFRVLGPFDQRIFLYGEDLDLGLRGAAQGIETWFWPQARVVHHRAHASTRAFGSEPFELLARTRHDAVARCLGTTRARIDDGAQALTFLTRAAIKAALGRPRLRERRQLRAVLAIRQRAPR